MCKGIVNWFSDDEGLGLITPNHGGIDLCVHEHDIRGNAHYKTLTEGQKVVFDTEHGAEGVLAVNVTVM
jgi:cold shock CspA family protein